MTVDFHDIFCQLSLTINSGQMTVTVYQTLINSCKNLSTVNVDESA